MSHGQAWLVVANDSGTIPPEETVEIRLELSEAARFLPEGHYLDVVGFENLGDHVGDYENEIPARHLTTLPIDCSGSAETILTFWRWLGVDDWVNDRASISVSADSLRWITVWRNEEAVTDSAWTRVEDDISRVADGHASTFDGRCDRPTSLTGSVDGT